MDSGEVGREVSCILRAEWHLLVQLRHGVVVLLHTKNTTEAKTVRAGPAFYLLSPPPPPHTWSGTRGAIVEGCLGNCQLSSLGMQPRPTASNLSLYVAFLGCHRQDHQNTSAYKPHIPIQMQTKAYPLKDNVVSRLTTPPPPGLDGAVPKIPSR